MKRDWRIIRSILLGKTGYETAESNPLINYHFHLCLQRDWIDDHHHRGPAGMPARPTYAGHEAAALLENESHFEAALAEIERACIGASEEVLFKLIRLQQEAALLLVPAFTDKTTVQRRPLPGDLVECIHPRGSRDKKGNGIVIRRADEMGRIMVAWLRFGAPETAPLLARFYLDRIALDDITRIETPTREHLAELRALLDEHGTPHELR